LRKNFYSFKEKTLAFAIQLLSISTIILSLRIILKCDIIRKNWKWETIFIIFSKNPLKKVKTD